MEYVSKCCDYCNGTGVVFEAYDDIDDYVEANCPWCKGTGIDKPIPKEDSDERK